MAIQILFGSVSKSIDKASYVASKLKSFFEYGDQLGSAVRALAPIPDSELKKWTDLVCSHLSDAASRLPLASKAQFPTITAAQQAAVDKRSACFIREVDARSPLLAGEQLVGQGDFVTYLLNPYGSYAAGTPVLQRTTNLATLYYVATHVQVQPNGDLVDAPAVPPVAPQGAAAPSPPPALALAATGTGLPASTAEQIAKGLVWALEPPFGAIGATLLNLLFPGGDGGIDWSKVFKNFGQIVLDADTETKVSSLDADLNGVLSDINAYMNTKNEYVSTKTGKTDLTNQLLPIMRKANKIVANLQEKQFAQKGFITFMHAAGVELAILQEMAQQDPMETDPLQSGNVTTIVQKVKNNYPNNYPTFATTTLNAVLDGLATQRGQQVSGVLYYHHCDLIARGVVNCTSYYYFNDPAANYTSAQYSSNGKHDNPEARCQTDLNNYINQVEAQYRAQKSAEAQWIWNTIRWWQKLANTPLPQQPYAGS